jgi:hypothetical protein
MFHLFGVLRDILLNNASFRHLDLIRCEPQRNAHSSVRKTTDQRHSGLVLDGPPLSNVTQVDCAACLGNCFGLRVRRPTTSFIYWRLHGGSRPSLLGCFSVRLLTSFSVCSSMTYCIRCDLYVTCKRRLAKIRCRFTTTFTGIQAKLRRDFTGISSSDWFLIGTRLFWQVNNKSIRGLLPQ